MDLAPILILAAGASSRMGGADKLLLTLDGVALLARVAARALATGHPVTVVLPPAAPARAAALAGLAVQAVVAADAAQGLAHSLRAGLAALPAGPVLVLPADLPLLTTADLAAVVRAGAADPAAIWRGASDGIPGHPVLLPADLRPELAALQGDTGARAVLARHAARLRLVPLPPGHAVTDLDTPADWRAFRAAGGEAPPCPPPRRPPQ